MKDIKLDENDDIAFLSGDFQIDESTLQEVGIILGLTQGNLKEFPTLGANLYQLINSQVSQDEIKQRVMIHLAKDNKNYDEIKDYMQINTKTL